MIEFPLLLQLIFLLVPFFLDQFWILYDRFHVAEQFRNLIISKQHLPLFGTDRELLVWNRMSTANAFENTTINREQPNRTGPIFLKWVIEVRELIGLIKENANVTEV